MNDEDTEILLSDIELNLMGASPGLHDIGYRAYHKIRGLDSEYKALEARIDELLEKQREACAEAVIDMDGDYLLDTVSAIRNARIEK